MIEPKNYGIENFKMEVNLKVEVNILFHSNKVNKDIKRPESDNGREFESKSFRYMLKSHSIEHIKAQSGDHKLIEKSIDSFE